MIDLINIILAIFVILSFMGISVLITLFCYFYLFKWLNDQYILNAH